jgi:hypothetical protein
VRSGHPLSAKRRVQLTALAQLPLLLLDDGNCLRDQALDSCVKAAVRAELANAPRRDSGDRGAMRDRWVGGDADPAERGTRVGQRRRLLGVSDHG